MLIEYIYGKIILSLFVIVCAYADHKLQKVDIRIFYISGILGIFGYIWMFIAGIQILYLRIGIGLGGAGIIWLIGCFTKEQIGYGDAAFFTITGLIMGCKNIIVIGGSMVLAAIVSIIIVASSMITGNGVSNKRIPLLPVAGAVALIVMLFI